MGPTVALDAFLAVAPLAHPTRALRVPRGVAPSALVQVTDRRGTPVRSLGPIVPGDTGYLPWIGARAELGRHGDTLLVVQLSQGTVGRYHVPSGERIDEWQVRRYFREVAPRSEVLRFPWIQFGELDYSFYTPHITAAAFGPTGKLYAIRSYGYHWVPRPNQFIRNSGAWEPDRQGLEIYTPTGELTGAYSVPQDVRGIRVDAYGRLFVLVAGGVRVYQEPSAQPNVCRTRNITLPLT